MRKPVKNKIKIAPDSKYNSVRVAKFINYVMERGKKNTARNIVYQSFKNVKEKTKKVPSLLLWFYLRLCEHICLYFLLALMDNPFHSYYQAR